MISEYESKTTQNVEDTSLRKKIQEEIENLASLESIKTVLFFRIDGVLLESRTSDNYYSRNISTINWIKTIISKVGHELKNNLYRIAYSREKEHIYFYKVGSAAILACILDKYANLGLLAIEMDRIAYNVAEINEPALSI